jgi:hypothetical protein
LDIRLAQNRNSLDAWVDCLGDRLALAYVHDVADDGRFQLPSGEEWANWLAPFQQTRLKCLVMSAGEGQSDEAILAGRFMLEEVLKGG